MLLITLLHLGHLSLCFFCLVFAREEEIRTISNLNFFKKLFVSRPPLKLEELSSSPLANLFAKDKTYFGGYCLPLKKSTNFLDSLPRGTPFKSISLRALITCSFSIFDGIIYLTPS